MTLTATNPTIVDAVRRLLRSVTPSPFSVDGLASFEESVNRYIHDLILECVNVMNRHDATNISPQYVLLASRNIFRRRRKLLAIIGILGGAFLSAAFSALYELTKSPERPYSMVLTTFLLFGAGVVLVAYQIVHE
jgi:hypothetical protein